MGRGSVRAGDSAREGDSFPRLLLLPRLLFSIAVLLILARSGSNFAAAASYDLAAYRQELQAALTELRRDPAAAQTVAARLRAIERVGLADGSSVQPDLQRILADLEGPPPDNVTRASAGIEGILALLGLHARSGPPSAQAQERLSRVLARDEFQHDPDAQTLGEMLARWRAEMVAAALRLLEPLFRLIAAVVDWLGPAAPFLGLALIGGLVFWFARSLRRTIGHAVVELGTEPAARRLSGDEARLEAERLAQAGSFRLAIRALYLAVLLRLEERGMLQFDRALTNREVLSTTLVRSNEPLAATLAPLVERFDRFWYGGAPCSARDYDEFARLARSAWEAP